MVSFSVAFLVDSLDDNNVMAEHYNADKMRFCFLICLKNEVFSPFPRTKKKN